MKSDNIIPMGVNSKHFIQHRTVQSVGYDHLIPENEIVVEHRFQGVPYIVVKTGTHLQEGVEAYVQKLKESAKNESDAVS